jgi:hypothetical protein
VRISAQCRIDGAIECLFSCYRSWQEAAMRFMAMRFILTTLCTALLISTPLAFASAQPAPRGAAAEIPGEFKGFFDDLSQLMTKYPGLSDRFGVFDRKIPASKKPGQSTGQNIRSARCGSLCCDRVVSSAGQWVCGNCRQCEK